MIKMYYLTNYITTTNYYIFFLKSTLKSYLLLGSG